MSWRRCIGGALLVSTRCTGRPLGPPGDALRSTGGALRSTGVSSSCWSIAGAWPGLSLARLDWTDRAGLEPSMLLRRMIMHSATAVL